MQTVLTSSNKRIATIVLAVAAILAIPLIAMQFTDEVQWSTGDFVMMGAILLSAGLAYELIARRSGKTMYRVTFATTLLGALLLFWVNGAVGIIGSENQPANLLYGIVILVGLIGALVSRFKAAGMATTLFAATVVQLIVPLVAWMIWPDLSWGNARMAGVLVLNAFFAVLFLVSGVLFRQMRNA